MLLQPTEPPGQGKSTLSVELVSGSLALSVRGTAAVTHRGPAYDQCIFRSRSGAAHCPFHSLGTKCGQIHSRKSTSAPVVSGPLPERVTGKRSVFSATFQRGWAKATFIDLSKASDAVSSNLVRRTLHAVGLTSLI